MLFMETLCAKTWRQRVPGQEKNVPSVMTFQFSRMKNGLVSWLHRSLTLAKDLGNCALTLTLRKVAEVVPVPKTSQLSVDQF